MRTDQMRDDCLEQVAAYVGYRPWREMCAIKDELAELRAYKERTEAALTEFSSELSNYGGVPTNYYREELRRLGLWREGSA